MFLWLRWVFVVACRLFVVVLRLSLVVVHRLSCPEAGGIVVPDQDRNHVPCIGRWILNHWTTQKSLFFYIFEKPSHYFP